MGPSDTAPLTRGYAATNKLVITESSHGWVRLGRIEVGAVLTPDSKQKTQVDFELRENQKH